MYASTGDYRHHGEAMLALGLLSPLNKIVATTALAMWDESDITSLFTTHTGETQVSTDGDTVGLMLDARPAYAAGFSTVGAWIDSLANDRDDGAIGLVGSATAATYDTGTGAGSATRVDASNQSYIAWTGLVALSWYRLDVEATGANGLILRTGTVSDPSVRAISGNTRTTTFMRASAGGQITLSTAASAVTSTFIVHSFKAVPGIHRAQATNTKRPLYRISGALKSMQYDGLDDCLPTISTIDLTATDELTLCAGLRKLSDAADAVLVEASASASSNNGAVRLNAPSGATASYGFDSRGTVLVQATYTNAAVAAPNSAVLTGLADISTDTCTLRANGVQVATSASDQGTGNFGNHIWNFGSRNNGASLPFNGHEYGVILQASLAVAETLANYERWANQRTAAY